MCSLERLCHLTLKFGPSVFIPVLTDTIWGGGGGAKLQNLLCVDGKNHKIGPL